MIEQGKKTATYKVTSDPEGFVFRFFCDSSGKLCCVTKPIRADTEEVALDIAWETENRHHFNRCDRCGRYVSSVMFNLTVDQCVDCAPWEDNYPTFCHQYGARLWDPEGTFYSVCGAALGETLFDLYGSRHTCCPGCGIAVTRAAVYCPVCGTRSEQRKAAAV